MNISKKKEDTEMKRRVLAFVLAAVMVLTVMGCGQSTDTETTAAQTEAVTEAEETESAAEEDTLYTAGTYTASSTGMNGAVTVEVTFDDDSITDITVTEQSETYGVGQGLSTSPVEVLPEKIVEYQSVNVESVTGATITSAAIKLAVMDCIEQAGGDSSAMETVTETADLPDAMEADVIIVGAGAAGLSASITAAEAGADVIIIEKQGVTGGSTARSGGKILAAGTPWQEAQDQEDDPDQMYEYLMSFSNGLINESLLRMFCDDSAENLAWLEDLGVQVQDVEPIHSSLTPWRVHNTLGGGGQTTGHGGQITVPLTEAAQELGVNIIYNTSAQELVTDEDGAVVGVIAETSDGQTVTFSGNAVILASGGYCSNTEMFERYADFIPVNYTSAPAGNVGDGLVMATAIGAKEFDSEGMQLVYCSFTCGVGINEESGLIVDAAGTRVVNEWTYQSHVAEALRLAGSPIAYYIATSNDPNATVQYGMTLDSTVSAGSVEELAELIGMDPAVLSATVDRYNELCDLGEDLDFGKPAEYMIPVEGETYYAIAMSPTASVTFGGLSINEEAQVLDVNDEPIENLYAAGEVAFTGLFGTEYPCCGMAIGSSVYFGRIAGANAAAEQ